MRATINRLVLLSVKLQRKHHDYSVHLLKNMALHEAKCALLYFEKWMVGVIDHTRYKPDMIINGFSYPEILDAIKG